jgi:hypothetical protein
MLLLFKMALQICKKPYIDLPKKKKKRIFDKNVKKKKAKHFSNEPFYFLLFISLIFSFFQIFFEFKNVVKHEFRK